jgi:hypothetical protein
MKVYLIKTPEYEIENFKEVCDLLSSYDGPIEFIPSFYEFDNSNFYFLRYELFPYHSFKYPSNDTAIKFEITRGFPLSWRELFSLCFFYREMFNIENSAFVILLTKRKNSLNWFSASDNSRNIFVHAAEWEYYTEVSPKYPIAYQVLKNVMQSLMNINAADGVSEFIHEPPKGCMNDICFNKEQIIIKLQTANICKRCRNKINDEKVDLKTLKQARQIFEGIRNEFIFHVEDQPTDPSPLIIDKKGKILLSKFQLEIKLTPLFKTLYLFFLSKPDGVTLNQLSEFKGELLDIYKKLRPGVSKEQAQESIEKMTHPFGDSFNPIKSHINKKITDLLSEPLADFYRISGKKGGSFYVKVPRNLIDIRY